MANLALCCGATLTSLIIAIIVLVHRIQEAAEHNRIVIDVPVSLEPDSGFTGSSFTGSSFTGSSKKLKTVSETPTPPAQKQALIALYDATGGNNWANKWNISGDPCADSWYGIKCNGNIVYALSLQQNQLIGTIPPEIAGLSYLEFFYLSSNKLGGTIPAEVGSMIRLQQIGFDKNDLVGTIPATFAKLVRLQSLFLQDNGLTGGLDSISGLRSLQYAYFSRNQLSGTIPEALGDIYSLQQLGIDYNQFSGTIPSGFGAKQNLLQSFYVQNNLLTGEFNKNLCHVQNCDCSGNSFSCPVPAPPCCLVQYCS